MRPPWGVLVLWGVETLLPGSTALGMVGVTGGKPWHVDRVAWIYADMTAEDPAPRDRGWPGLTLPGP